MKRNILICLIIVIGTALILSSSCQKDEDNPVTVNLTNGKTTAVFNPNKTYGTLTDIDGNIYKTITIGSQTWMAENLRTTKHNDGTGIRLAEENNAWTNSYNKSTYCNYNNTSNNDSIATFGRLYNGFAVFTGKLAPVGWHVPTDDEWATLINYLGTDTIPYFKLQEIGSTHWLSPHNSVTNESGFTALPGGFRYGSFGTNFMAIGKVCRFWTSSEHEENANNAWCWRWDNNNNYISYGRNWKFKCDGYSVRCVKD